MKNFLFILLFLLGAVPVLHAEQVVTGTVQSINPEARSVTIDQTNAPTGELRTVYIASVIDSDLVNVDSFEDLKVGDMATVRVSSLQNISYAPSAIVEKKIIKEKKQSENLFEDVGEVHPRSLSID